MPISSSDASVEDNRDASLAESRRLDTRSDSSPVRDAPSDAGPGNTGFPSSSLPNCTGTPIFSTLPMALSDFSFITPLGNINPQAHTAPTNHLYFAYSPTSTKRAFAPGDVHITYVEKKTYASTGNTDFQVQFGACKEVTTWYDHIALDSAIEAKIAAYNGGCVDRGVAGTAIKSCTAFGLDIFVANGTFIGTGGSSNNLDVGTRDTRIDLSFLNAEMKKTYGNTACPLDYFSGDTKLALEATLGGPDGIRRTSSPICGKVDYDLADTARGIWVLPNQSTMDERNLLTLAPHNYRDGKQTIGNGTDANSATNAFAFTPTSTGQVNRDFAQVRADGTTFCYDTFINARIGTVAQGSIVLIKLTGKSALSIERQGASACGSGPWTMTGGAQNFVR